MTKDSSEKFYHKVKRPRTRFEALRTAINEDHPHAHTSRNNDDVIDGLELNAIPDAVSLSKKSQLMKKSEEVIPETDDEHIRGSQPDCYDLNQEDLDFWKEEAKQTKASASKLLSKDKKVAVSSLPQTSMMRPTSKSNDVQRKNHFQDKDAGSVKATQKGKSLRSASQQSSRKQLLDAMNSQSSQECVSSSQPEDRNSDDDFRPRRTKRKTSKKNSK